MIQGMRDPNEIQIQEYPILEEGNDTFPEGNYRVNSSPINKNAQSL